MKAVVGFSDHADLDTATRSAVRTALDGAPAPALVLYFVTHSHGRERFEAYLPTFATLLPEGTLRAGGIVNGLAYGNVRCDAMFNKFAVAVVALSGSDLRVAAALGRNIVSEPKAAGREVAEEIRRQLGSSDVKSGLAFPPGLGVGVPILDQYVLDGIAEVLPSLRLSGCGLTSGMRLDGLSEAAVGFLGDRVQENGTLLVVFDGIDGVDTVENGAEQGRPGSVRVAEAAGNLWTRVEGGEPEDVVLSVLAGDDAAARAHFTNNPAIASAEHMVTLAQRDGDTAFFWAQPPAAFTPDGAVVGILPLDTTVPLSLVDIDAPRAIQAVEQAARSMSQQAGGQELDLVLSFSCAMRGFTLGPRVSEEPAVLRKNVSVREHLVIVANGEVGARPGGRNTATVWAYSACGLKTKSP